MIRRWPRQLAEIAPLLIAITVLSVVGFLWISARTSGLGFPLDDAWIHQTYARNLVEYGEWAFLSGQPSSGSTSPLWTVMIAVGGWLHLDPKVWSYLLGCLLLVTSAWICGRWLALRSRASWRWWFFVAMLLVLEWHMVWISVSGMETIALILLVLIVVSWIDSQNWNSLGMGMLIGLGVWLRPDALSLLIPVAWHVAFLNSGQFRKMLHRMGLVLIGVMLLVGPYMAFNYALSYELWPTTFYAKQTEYAVYREIPFFQRFWAQLVPPLAGVSALLVPGLILVTIVQARQGSWWRLAPLLWVLSYVGAYAVRLPANYQHGRYAIPIIPVVLVLGIEGMKAWVEPYAKSLFRRLFSRAWLLALPVLAIIFWWNGAQAYAQDVAIIETEMVAASEWIATHTESEALIAAHDIGALGYFGERTIIDMAGLVSPEVIPILRDEEALARLLDARGADYLMTFPGWYPKLVERAELIYTTDAPHSIRAGGENMTIYRWRPQGFAP
ncbi:MAG TPA: hypothetical protein G4O11_07010 [Anaerolineae bacterium]|nr:hypothetical protein [Anaerolineae bacterium]